MELLKKIFKRPEKSDFRKTVDANRQKHKALKAKWDNARLAAKDTSIGLQEIHISEAGNIYYIHTNILDICFARYMEMLKALQKIEFRMTSKEFDLILDNILRANQKGDKDRISREVSDAKMRHSRLPEKRSIVELALTLIYRHDENPYKHNAIMQAKKITEMQNDADLEVFFCEEGWEKAKLFLPENLGAFKELNAADFLQQLLDQQKKKAIG